VHVAFDCPSPIFEFASHSLLAEAGRGVMETKTNPKEADKEARSRLLLWVLIMLVFLGLLASLMLLLGWLANQAGE
jgi:hypothetical protein